MKKNLLRGLFTACLTIACTLTASAKVYLTEDFNYPAGEELHIGTEPSTSHWSNFAGFDGDDYILVKDANLTYSGYSEITTTKSVELLLGRSTLADDLHGIPEITSGCLYYAALVRIDDIKDSNSADYFLAFGNGTSGSMVARLYSKANADRTAISLGIAKFSDGSATDFTTTEYAKGSTLLLIAKYEFVDGEKNDIASLFINPVASSTEPQPTITCHQPTANNNKDATSISSINLRAGSSTPNLIIDAIRVADTWADLFPAAGDGGDSGNGSEDGDDTGATPMLECGVLAGGELSSYAQLDGAVVGEEITCTLHIAGKDLKGDITLTAEHADILSINPSSVSKADAEAGGKEVIVTIKPSSSMFTQYTITASSEEAEDFPISIYCMAQQPPYTSLNAFINDFPDGSGYEYTVESDMVVTHVFQQNGAWCAYIQDATAGVRVYDAYASMQSYKTGDRIADLNGALEYSFGVYSINTNNAPYNPTVIKNEPAEPIAIGIADMPNYVGRLVRINNVAIATANNKTTITAGEATAELTTFSGSDVEIAALPAEADLIGIVRSANATVRRISPRSKADIISRVASNLNNITTSKVWAADGALYIQGAEDMQVEVLNVAGQTILTKAFAAGTHTVALDGGMYLVKVNGTVEKLIVR